MSAELTSANHVTHPSTGRRQIGPTRRKYQHCDVMLRSGKALRALNPSGIRAGKKQ